MYQEVLRGVEGVGIFPAISLLVFVTVFAMVLVHAARLDRDGVRQMAALPLDDQEETR